MRGLCGVLVVLAGCAAEDPAVESDVQSGVIAPSALAPDALPAKYPLRTLQMNLCNSGFASCFENGQSVPEAATVIQGNKPDIVTLNEICQPDVAQLATTMSGVFPGSTVVWAFKAAQDRRTSAPFKCKNGQDYGNGVIVHVPAAFTGFQTFSGVYAAQDTASSEERSWVCLYATGNFYACTTHLASTSGTVALSQCKDLTNTQIPQVQAAGGLEPTVLGGDWNLKFHGSPDAQTCVPPGYYRKGDGDVQHIMVTNNLVFGSTKSITMHHTDHPGWLVAVTAP